MQYYGQLNDIEIVSPHAELEDDAQLDDLIAEFEDAYGKVYARSARSPELGLPGHPGDRPRLGGGREAGAARPRRARGDAAAQGHAPGPLGRRLRRHRRLRARRRRGRQLDRRPGDRRVGGDDLRDPAGTLARLDRHQIFH